MRNQIILNILRDAITSNLSQNFTFLTCQNGPLFNQSQSPTLV